MNPHHPPQPASPAFARGSNRGTCSSLGCSWHSLKIFSLALAFPALLLHESHAAELTSSNLAAGDFFGYSVSASGSSGLVGAYNAGAYVGSVYLFRDLDTTVGLVSENAKLTPSDNTFGTRFGRSTSLSGSIGLVGADALSANRGKAYLYRNLDTATGTITQDAELTPSVSQTNAFFGQPVVLSGTTGLIGASGDSSFRGAAYLFRNLDTATGAITENAKLTASDGVADDYFGFSSSLSGNIGLVGAMNHDSIRGAAYVFRNLDAATGAITQNAKLLASDGVAADNFGNSVSLSGSMGLVGANYVEAKTGAAYLFRGLDTATGTINENAKLICSDREAYDYYADGVSLSGINALVGCTRDNEKGTRAGAAYLYTGLDTATGTITEAVKVMASDGATNNDFGYAVSLENDNFLVGAYYRNSAAGKAYSGSFSSMTTLNAGNADKLISGLDFVSRTDWIIGQTTDANSVALESGSRANVTASGKKIYIGKDAESDNNTLFINGNLTATEVRVGATGNTGNALILEPDGIIQPGCDVHVASGSSIGGNGSLEGNLTLDSGAKLEFVSTLGLEVQGTATLHSTFGVDDILGLSGSIAPATYVLISNSTTDFSTLGLQNFGSGNAGLIGGTKAAYLTSPTQGTLSLTVYTVPIPVVSSAASTSGRVGTALTYQITASNSPTSFSANGLPAGLTINTSTGRISGTPTTAGTFNTTVRATTAGGTGTKVVAFTILPLPPVITSVATDSGKVATALTYQITASNSPTSFSALSLPAGLTINPTTGKITGKPTTAGRFNTTVRATNAGGTGTKVVAFTIGKETTDPVLSVTQPLSLRVTTSTTSFTVKGNATDNISPTNVEYRINPPGLAGYGAYKSMTLAGTAKSKTWSHTLTKLTPGVWTIQFRARDDAGNISTSKIVTITKN